MFTDAQFLTVATNFSGEKLVLLKSRLQQAMAVRRQEERERRAALHRLDNEDCEEEEEEEDLSESEDEEVSKFSFVCVHATIAFEPIGDNL